VGDDKKFDLDDPDELQAEEDRLLNDYDLPRQGDKLFVETDSAARLDSLGLSDPLLPETRPLAGRRKLYSDGYLLAGDRIVDSLTGAPWEDALIYPILYLYRHHIELELKGLIAYSLNHLPNTNTPDIEAKFAGFKNGHKLSRFWDLLKEAFPKWAEGSSPASQLAFEALLTELAEHDPVGQAARYEVDTKEKPTLATLRLVDLPTLKIGIHKISNYLRCIYEGIGQEVEWRAEMASW
jgi:hypothetical protein